MEAVMVHRVTSEKTARGSLALVPENLWLENFQ